MAELKGSKTEKNLLDAFAGESQARNKYTYFASVAKKEGYEQMAAIFLETAEQEKEHAKLRLKALSGIGDTAANLKAAAAGEGHEWTAMYPEMAKVIEKYRSELFDLEKSLMNEGNDSAAKYIHSIREYALDPAAYNEKMRKFREGEEEW